MNFPASRITISNMKAAILESPGRLIVKEVPDPKLQSGSVLLKVKVCSICPTDVRTYRYGHPRIELPQILGHEIAGEIEATKGVTGYKTGDRVALTPRIACGKCFYCLKGQHIYCENSLTFGYQLPGGYAQYVLVPARGVEYGVLNKIADTLSLEEASLAEHLACSLRAQKALRVEKGDTVVVIGGGPVGIMHCRLAKLNGAGKVILIEREVKRLELVNLASVDNVVDSSKTDPKAEILALTEGRGADAVIVACSSTQAQEESLYFAGKGGRVDFFGGLPAGQSNISLDSNLIHYQEISVLGSHSSTPEDNRAALDLLARKCIEVDDLVTKAFPLDSIEEAFRFAQSNAGMNVAIRP